MHKEATLIPPQTIYHLIITVLGETFLSNFVRLDLLLIIFYLQMVKGRKVPTFRMKMRAAPNGHLLTMAHLSQVVCPSDIIHMIKIQEHLEEKLLGQKCMAQPGTGIQNGIMKSCSTVNLLAS